VIDPVLNLSDHRPISVNCDCMVAPDLYSVNTNTIPNLHKPNRKMSYLRWDRANLADYRELTRVNFTQILSDIRASEKYALTLT